MEAPKKKLPKFVMRLTTRQMGLFRGEGRKDKIRELLKLPKDSRFMLGDTVACLGLPIEAKSVYRTEYFGKPYYYIIIAVLSESTGTAMAYTVNLL